MDRCGWAPLVLQAHQGMKTSSSGLGEQASFHLEEICCCFASYSSTKILVVASALVSGFPLRVYAILRELSNSPSASGMACSRLALAEYLISRTRWLVEPNTSTVRYHETATGTPERETSSLSLDLFLRGHEAGSAGGHLVTMREETTSVWSQCSRSGPEKQRETKPL